MTLVVDDELEKIDTVETEIEVSEIKVPEKFADKSAGEIAQSYVELEKELGRKNNEVGELRKLTDQYLTQELTRHDPKKEETALEYEDLLEDPTRSIESVVNPKLDEINKKLALQEQARELQAFQTKYPEYQEVGASEEFLNWANANEYRKRQFDAAQQFDFTAAGDLLDTYMDQTASLREAAEEGKKTKREKDLKAAGSEPAGTGETSQKMWTRAELLEMRKDPDKWDMMQPEIIKAYQENRVKT